MGGREGGMLALSCHEPRVEILPLHCLSDSTDTTGGQEEGVLRLMDGKDSYLSGRVEIYMKKEWGTVQYDSSQQKGVAQTVCQQLGYGIPTAYGTVEDLG